MKRLLRGDVTLLLALLVALAIVAVRLTRQKARETTESFPHYTVSSSAPSVEMLVLASRQSMIAAAICGVMPGRY